MCQISKERPLFNMELRDLIFFFNKYFNCSDKLDVNLIQF